MGLKIRVAPGEPIHQVLKRLNQKIVRARSIKERMKSKYPTYFKPSEIARWKKVVSYRRCCAARSFREMLARTGRQPPG